MIHSTLLHPNYRTTTVAEFFGLPSYQFTTFYELLWFVKSSMRSSVLSYSYCNWSVERERLYHNKHTQPQKFLSFWDKSKATPNNTNRIFHDKANLYQSLKTESIWNHCFGSERNWWSQICKLYVLRYHTTWPWLCKSRISIISHIGTSKQLFRINLVRYF